VITTHYIDGFQYSDDKLEFFPTAEGYVKATHTSSGGLGGGTFDKVYNETRAILQKFIPKISDIIPAINIE
jgi:hypothetical protein